MTIITPENIFYTVCVLGYLGTTIGIYKNLGKIEKGIYSIKLDMSDNYVKKSDLDTFKSANTIGHKEIWQEVNRTRENVSEMKGKVSNLIDGKIIAYKGVENGE